MKSIIIAMIAGLGFIGWLKAEEPKAEVNAPITILFLGDSITRAGGYIRTIEATLAKEHPSAPVKVINKGRNSETVSDLSEAYHPGRRPCLFTRLDAELAAAKPKWVVACYGMNDGIYHPFNEKRFTAYQNGIKTLIQKVQATGARVVLLTPPPYALTGPFPEGADAAAKDEVIKKAEAVAEAEAEKNPNKFGYRTPFEYYDSVLDRYAKWLLTLDGHDGVLVVDVRSPMLARAKETHDRDPIHPNAIGHSIMAEAFLKQSKGKVLFEKH